MRDSILFLCNINFAIFFYWKISLIIPLSKNYESSHHHHEPWSKLTSKKVTGVVKNNDKLKKRNDMIFYALCIRKNVGFIFYDFIFPFVCLLKCYIIVCFMYFSAEYTNKCVEPTTTRPSTLIQDSAKMTCFCHI